MPGSRVVPSHAGGWGNSDRTVSFLSRFSLLIPFFIALVPLRSGGDNEEVETDSVHVLAHQIIRSSKQSNSGSPMVKDRVSKDWLIQIWGFKAEYRHFEIMVEGLRLLRAGG